MGQASSSARAFHDHEEEEHSPRPNVVRSRRRETDFLNRTAAATPSSSSSNSTNINNNNNHMVGNWQNPSTNLDDEIFTVTDNLRTTALNILRNETARESGTESVEQRRRSVRLAYGREKGFVPSVSERHEWMGRSIETLILGSTSLAPVLAIDENHDDGNGANLSEESQHEWGSQSRRSSPDFLQRRSSLDIGVHRPRPGIRRPTLSNDYNLNSNDSGHGIHAIRHRRSSLSNTKRSTSESRHQSGPNIALSLLAREVTGRQPSRAVPPATQLRQLGGKTLYDRVDNPAAGIVTEITKLQNAINRGDWTETSSIVSQLTPRLMGDPMRQNSPVIDDPSLPRFASPYHAGGGRLGLERDAFVLGGGVPVFIKIFREPAFIGRETTNDARDLNRSIVSNKLSSCWNEVLVSLRELVFALPILVENRTIMENGKFVPFLFTLLSHESCFDAAATLIEEILSLQSHSPPPPIPPNEASLDGEFRSMTFVIPVTTFFLGEVPDLYALWRGFNTRQLAHFCRILALLVFEPEDRQLLESPAVLKSLELLQLRRDRAARAGRDATVDMNQAMLIGDKVLMQRLLHLLQVMNYAPTLRRSTAYHVMAHFPFISETLVMLGLSEMESWSDIDRLDALAKTLVSRAEDGTSTDLSELGNVAEMLESLAGTLQGNSMEPATQLGHIIHVINAAQQAGVVVGRRGGRRHRQNEGSSIHVSSVPLESPSLDSLASAAMTLTDQVILRRNGVDVSDGIMLNIVDIQEDHIPEPHPHQYATTGRLRITNPEDAANELQFNALLLAPYQVEVLFVLCTLLGGRRKIDTQKFLYDHGLIPIMDDMFHRLSFGAGLNQHRSMHRSNGGNSSAGGNANQEGEEEPIGIHGPGCDCTPESALSVQYLRLLHNFCDRDCDNYPGRRLLLSLEEREYIFSKKVWVDNEKPSNLRQGLFSKIIGAFSRESDDSPYRFWLASCAESYLRGSSPHEQLFAAKSGLLPHLVNEIVSDRLHCAGSLQTSFDLLGEVCKGNSEVLTMLVSSLDEEIFRKLMSAAASNLVDSNVFLRSLLMTVERVSAARFFRTSKGFEKEDPWKEHEYGPWTGLSGPSTRFYLTHSWWDASIRPLTPAGRSQVKKAKNEESYDRVRSSDWFPPGFGAQGRTALGEATRCQQSPLHEMKVGYNGWVFSPPASVQSPLEGDPFAWAMGEAAFLPNTIERLAWFLITNQSRLLRDLLCVVDLRNINHENICCLNTAVVVAMFASKRGQLSGVLRELQCLNEEERTAAFRRDNAQFGESADELLANTMDELRVGETSIGPSLRMRGIPSMLGDRTDVIRNFRELLWFWSEYYTHRGRDRLSLEFSSHMRFQDWYTVVSQLSEDDGSNSSLMRKQLKLPRSPYQRSARIVDNPRRSG